MISWAQIKQRNRCGKNPKTRTINNKTNNLGYGRSYMFIYALTHESYYNRTGKTKFFRKDKKVIVPDNKGLSSCFP
jgi:hypothetical protein